MLKSIDNIISATIIDNNGNEIDLGKVTNVEIDFSVGEPLIQHFLNGKLYYMWKHAKTKRLKKKYQKIINGIYWEEIDRLLKERSEVLN